jgi:exopolysaccharide biosynthesis polyprenyl glycosylphosphotransferase
VLEADRNLVANGALDLDQPQGSAHALLPDRDVRRKRPPALSFLLRMATLRRALRVLSLLALDFAGVWAALFTALLLKALVKGGYDLHEAARFASGQTRDFLAFAYLLTILLFARSDLYAERSRRPGLTRIVTSLFQVTIVALVFSLASGHTFSSYYIFYGSFALAILTISLLRWAHTRVTGWLLASAGYSRRTLLVGSGRHLDQVAHALADSQHGEIEPVGYVSLTPRPDNGLRSLGELADLPQILADHRVQDVIIADPDFPQDKAVELVDACHRRGVEVHVAPSTMGILTQRAEFVPGQSLPLFTLKPPVFEGVDFAIKRTFDVIGAMLLLVLLSPLLAAIALAVKLTSRGPVLYRSARPGMGGAPFACLKFRTMRADAEHAQERLESLNEMDGALFKIREDPRLTPVGRLLRRFSLDELPQLVNVVRGEMSLVGPRPLPLRDFAQLEEWHKKRYLVLPGITGLWQVSGRAELDFDELVRLDFLYLERWSVALDLVILLKTVPAVLMRRGAF